MGSELDSKVRGWDAFELVCVAGVWADEIEVTLLVIIEDDGLICVIELCLCAGRSLLIFGFNEVVPLFFVVEEEVDRAHLGVHPLVL